MDKACPAAYTPSTRITFDAAKNARNIAERGLPFALVADLDWAAAVANDDIRRDYGERSTIIAAPLSGRLHIAVITRRDGAVHVISFRKANKKEVKIYGQTSS